MLSEMRSGVSGFFAKILLVLLVISFAFWGIGDIVTRTAPGVVATVGAEDISISEFQRAIRDIRNTLGEHYSPELVKSLNLYQIKLNDLIHEKLLLQEAERLGISVSDDTIARMIGKDKMFQNPNGNFDRGMFSQILSQQGYSESDYIDALRRKLSGGIILRTLTQKPAYVPEMLDLLYKARYETRKITLITLSNSAALTKEPTEQDLQGYFKKNQAAYRAPEFRSLQYILIDPAAIIKNTTVSRTELMELYQSRSSTLVKPEQREVEQLLYSQKDKAEKAYEMLMAGNTIPAVAKIVPPINEDSLELGLKTQGELPTGDKEVFGLDEGEFTKPVESPFGWHVFGVTKIQESRPLAFKDVKDSLEEELKQTKAEKELIRLAEKLEDTYSSGASLSEIATTLGVELKQAGPIDAEGNAPDRRSELDSVRFANSLKAAFELDKGEMSDIQTEADGSYVALELREITPARDRTFDEVRGAVASDWKKAELVNQLANNAKELGEQIAKSGNLSALDSKPGVKVETGTLNREGAFMPANGKEDGQQSLPEPLAVHVFLLSKKQPVTPPLPSGDVFLMAKLEEVLPAAAPGSGKSAKQDYDALKRSLAQDYRDEVLLQYFNSLRKLYPVTVNYAVIEAMMKQD